jgi:ParB/RepB/Spo0J family partition protein
VLEPLIITPQGVVVAGHRRLLAARLAGRPAVPAIARPLSEVQQLEVMLVENVQRAALTPLEEAHGFQRLVDRGVTQMDIARRVGVTSAYVKERLVILRLAPAVQALYGRNALPITLVRVLLEVEDEARQVRVAHLAAERGLPVPQIEALVRRGKALQETGRREKAAAAPAPEPRRLGPDREQAVALLVKNPTQHVSFTRLFGVMDAVCCACGTHEVTPQMCRECPLPKFITLLALPPDKLRALRHGRGDDTVSGNAA